MAVNMIVVCAYYKKSPVMDVLHNWSHYYVIFLYHIRINKFKYCNCASVNVSAYTVDLFHFTFVVHLISIVISPLGACSSTQLMFYINRLLAPIILTNYYFEINFH